MRHKRIKNLIVGGALIGAFFVTDASAYNQDYTHPALTDEIVDFYNLNFPQQLNNQDKTWLIKGSMDEDQGMRPMNHFYDPVHNIGMAGFPTSKQWAMSSGAQSNLAMSNNSIAQSAGVIKSPDDFSYQRAMGDYAQGDRQRAMTGFGHLLHLLEDAGVPDHTRNDPHPPVGTFGSPYEHEMAKWSPENFNIASGLKKEGLKPVILANLGDYFDKLARYSNGNFFSKDTINDSNYADPVADFWTYKKDQNGAEDLIGHRKDKKGNYILVKNLVKTGELTILDKDILDGYWDRLSREVVLNGAGALNLLITEAEKAKTEYANRPQEKPSWFSRLLGLIGLVDKELTPSDGVAPSDGRKDGGDNVVTPSSEVTKPLVTPTSLVTKTPVTNVTMLSPTPSPSVSPSPVATPKLSTAKTSGRVVINEIAWAGTQASATDEWLELYNAENVPIDLSSWQLVSSDDSPDIIFPEGTIIQANSYFLIERTDDNTISDITADLAISFGQGGLNNAGEMVRLFDSAGTVVDVVGGAGETWYFGDSTSKNSMERIDQMKAGNSASNWKSFSGTPVNKDAAGNLVNGTPKTKNSVAVQVVVSTGGGGGGSSSSPTPTPTPTPTPSPDPSSPLLQVVINEIAWMGTSASLSSDEWMELYNTTDAPISLDDWVLISETDSSPNITLTGTIGAFGYYLIERTDDGTVSDITADFKGSFGAGGLKNTGEKLVLKDGSSTIQDVVDGSSAWFDKGTTSPDYKSMERVNPKQFGGDATNWETNNGATKNGLDAAGNPINGTPGARNSVYVSLKPSAVINLAVTGTGGNFGQFSLTWSAPEDIDTLSANLSYDLRYATKSFATIDDWDTAHKLASASLPVVAVKGASESASFSIGSNYDTKWFFALKTKDQTDISDISNIPDMTTKSAISDSWGMLGTNQFHTSFLNEKGVDPKGLKKATISWEFDAGDGNIVSQPVVSANGDVFFGASDGITAGLYGLDKNGIEKWPPYATNTKPGTTVVLSDGSVYFGKDGVITALNPNGSLKWTYDSVGTGTGPLTLAEDGSIYFASWGNNKLNALKSDGSLKWQIGNPIGNFGTFSPIILENGNVVIPARVSDHSYFYTYASASGSQMWEATFPEGYGYLPSHPSFDVNTGKINSAAGHYLVQLTEVGGLTKTLIDSNGISATMVSISPSNLIVGFDFTNYNPASGSQVIAMDKATKEIKWRYRVDSRINNQIAIDKDENVYFSTQNGKLYGLDSNGGLMWVIDVGTNTEISPVLAKNTLIWGYGSRLTGIGVK